MLKIVETPATWTIEIKSYHRLLAESNMTKENALLHASKVLSGMTEITSGEYRGGYRGMDAQGEQAIFLPNEICMVQEE